MLVAAAVCPCPPLLVPDVAAGAAPELDGTRTACTQAIEVLAAARPDRLVVVGTLAGSGHETYPGGTGGSFRSFGVDLDVRLGASPDLSAAVAPGPALPPSLAVAAWLLGHARWPSVPVAGLGVGEHLGADRCRETGAGIAERPGRVALLVMGDGSACRSVKAPGYFDERADAFDAEAARALAAADVAALGMLDEKLAGEVKAAGRAPWQVLAGAADNADLQGKLLYDDAPYGVGYLVAAWS
jgi:hypothetical protein